MWIAKLGPHLEIYLSNLATKAVLPLYLAAVINFVFRFKINYEIGSR